MINTDISTPIITYLKQLESQGITDIEIICEKLFQQLNRQIELGLYSNDRYIEFGSDVAGTVVSATGNFKVECILWCINHYLGLNRNANVINKVCEAVKKFGTGSGTSALSGGMSSLHKEVELKIRNLIGKENVILFPTGYSANLGTLSALPGKKDLILFDRESHASLIDGIKLSGKKWMTFKHNNVNDLNLKLQKYSQNFENIFVVVESAYSMSGDIAPLREIIELKQKYKFLLYVDEAHTFGIYGKNGAGYCSELGIVEQVDFIVATLSKATASIGGFLATKSKYLPLLKWRANSYAFQACLTPSDAAAILASLEEIENNPQIVEQLHHNNQYMRQRLTSIGFNLGTSKSPIIPIFMPDEATLISLNKELFTRGIFSVSIFYPVVKPKEGRIRFILSASHTKEQIDKTINALQELGIKYNIIPPSPLAEWQDDGYSWTQTPESSLV
ncbi:aminotransferase class I/II-fold pyridoxal phosphate-dependent enzyme [Nostoc sp. FACHB-152]|uniref:aminotransferase class I/II-fold pyridoxal phosphate-dependent enzyme n=1 Tax=unclassified Nostoc TaxID=2593658 RepID=UPI0016847032|nr:MULTISPECIES: aminotransferase class I/II-fold pyridoxal phosphate-dependent enzyme [unclassified Nostoc]MBD2448127.1 aminotransferase class I/II-fold pyridoxal phosphate-dependent enzyme [Nostoc sp. FACHB-152]MBD2467125.1 aminotransferase class I/II-fold pyridoxal phosphate-dependent enzyme [Nostoc sp. FACHB-145]